MTIPAGVVLVMEEGAEVRFLPPDPFCADSDPTPLDYADAQGTGLHVHGELRIEGSRGHLVRLGPGRPAGVPHVAPWEGVRIRPGGRAFVRWAVIENARRCIEWDAADGGAVHVLVHRCELGFSALRGAAPEVRSSVSHGAGLAGFWVDRSSPILEGNLALRGNGWGLRLRGFARPRIRHNGFWDNALGAVNGVHGEVGVWIAAEDTTVVRDPLGNIRALDGRVAGWTAPDSSCPVGADRPRGGGTFALCPDSPFSGARPQSLRAWRTLGRSDLGLFGTP